jgi:hypothetical protein
MMNQFDCQNLTSSIMKLSGAKARVDLAINKSEPFDGVDAMKKADVMLEEYDLLLRVGYEKYKILAEIFQGKEGTLKTEIFKVTIGGMNADETMQALRDKSVVMFGGLDRTLMENMSANTEARNMQSRSPREIEVVRVQVTNLDCEEHGYYVKLKDIRQKIQEAGLLYCPPDVTPSILIREEIKLRPNGGKYVILTENLTDQRGDPLSFILQQNGNKPYLLPSGATSTTSFDKYLEMLFCLPDRRNKSK